MLKLFVGLAAISLVSCTSISFGPLTEEVIEGNPETYPAFEAAARACSFERVRRVTDDTGRSHFLIKYAEPMTTETRCLLDWLQRNAEGQLLRSAD